MNELKSIDTRESVRTVTSNSFITACGLESISLKARKLLYLAIAQCRKTDNEFYEYTISVIEFSKLMQIHTSNVYQEAEAITDELMRGFIKILPENEKKFKKYALFSKCGYDGNSLNFKLNTDMTDFFLNLKKDFSKPLLDDFLKMKSPYSIGIWHLMQREMHSKKPGIYDEYSFILTVEELREVTGAQNKLKQIGQFKERILDKALREIQANCGVNITYTNIKKGRTVIAFEFVATSVLHMERVEEKDLPQKTQDKLAFIRLKQAMQERELTDAEKEMFDYYQAMFTK